MGKALFDITTPECFAMKIDEELARNRIPGSIVPIHWYTQ